jgi:hypothetical protein
MNLFRFTFCIIPFHLMTSLAGSSVSFSEERPDILMYPAMNETLCVSAFRDLLVDFRHFLPGTASTFHVQIQCEDEEDMRVLSWHDNFQWVQRGLIPYSNFPGIVTKLLVPSGAAPILHIEGEKPVVLICEIIIFDVEGNVLTRASNRFSIRNRRPASGGAAEAAESRKLHVSEHLDRGRIIAVAEDHAKWSEYHVEQRGTSFPSETWEVGLQDWKNWTHIAAVAAGRYVFESQSGAASLCEDQILENDFDFPVFVTNLQDRPDRRRHIERLLCDLGFSNVSFPNTTHADDLDIASLIHNGTVSPQAIRDIIGRHGVGALRPYISTAVDRISTLARAAAEGHALFGVFEDNIVAGACPAETNLRIAAALRELPPDADVLFLEACCERCAALRYSAHRPSLARAFWPFRSVGMIFTARGARRVASLCTPVTAGFDDMMQELVGRGLVDAYLALPGVLFQYSFLGADANQAINSGLQVLRIRLLSNASISMLSAASPSTILLPRTAHC